MSQRSQRSRWRFMLSLFLITFSLSSEPVTSCPQVFEIKLPRYPEIEKTKCSAGMGYVFTAHWLLSVIASQNLPEMEAGASQGLQTRKGRQHTRRRNLLSSPIMSMLLLCWPRICELVGGVCLLEKSGNLKRKGCRAGPVLML